MGKDNKLETIKTHLQLNIKNKLLNSEELYCLSKEEKLERKELIYEVLDIIEKYFYDPDE